ncbi:hypothetical protein SUGI_1074980 [Cryptomeria japonica]|nr:hypothetical protein SUGI_1074980 [Cryptomeria japonica]
MSPQEVDIRLLEWVKPKGSTSPTGAKWPGRFEESSSTQTDLSKVLTNAWQRFHGVQNCCKDVFYRSGCRQFYAFDYHTNSGSRIGFVSPQEIGKPFQSSFSVRFSSSKGDGPSSSEEKHVPVKDGGDHDKTKEVADESLGKPEIKEYKPPISESKDHARLGEQEQKEWLEFQRIISENRKLETVLVSTKTKFRYDYMRRLVPWEANSVSWETFPYFVELHTKDILLECATAHLKCHKFASIYGKNLSSSSCRILLQSMPGTELYRERLVKSLAHHLQVPLLTLDSSVLAPHDFSEESASEVETDDETEHGETGEECSSGSDVDDENDGSHEEEWTSSEGKYDASDEEERQSALATTLKNLSNGLEDLEKRVSGEDCEDTKHSSKESDDSESSQKSENVYKKGDRIKYIGVHEGGAGKNRPLGTGQRGEVYEVNGNKVAILVDSEIPKWDASKEEKSSGQAERPSLYLVDIQDIEHDSDAETEECFIAVEALHETIMSLGPVIVYFPDFSQWLARAVPKSRRKELIKKVGEMLDQISGPVVMICGQNKAEAETKDRDKFTMVLPHIGRLTRLPIPLKHLTEGLKAGKASKIDNLSKLFSNVLSIHPPKDEEILKTFNKQLEEDRRIIISRSNLSELHKVLEEHKLFCHDLLHIHTDGVILTSQNAEKVIGWARNHYLSICGTSPAVSGERLCLPRESLEIALSRLKEEESYNKKPTQDLKKLARDEYESNFLSAVVPPNEVGVKFDDIGALEDVKNTLQELVTLPMRRPELFRDGNLLRPCKGVLLFGPPGTGKTLLAKALATEAGANFISITGSTLTSKWFGDAEKLTKALFSFASKLAPVIIFVDEVDSLLGARGGASEHEATRRMRNEFMAAWDGLRSKENQRILILAATNRPFDLDDAVIRRLPRRIYVDLPDANNRAKILRVILAQERLDSGFDFNDLAHATEGYSGSDLKNLCIAAAYRPIQELLEEEKKVGRQINPSTSLRMLTVDDFIEAKKKVGASVSYDAEEVTIWFCQLNNKDALRRKLYLKAAQSHELESQFRVYLVDAWVHDSAALQIFGNSFYSMELVL